MRGVAMVLSPIRRTPRIFVVRTLPIRSASRRALVLGSVFGLVLGLALGLGACAPGGDGSRTDTPEVVVFAAASLRDVAEEIARELESRERLEVVFNFAGSNTLAQQIDAGPGADVFLSADEAWMDFLDRAGRLVEGSQRSLLSNRLVLIAHREAAIEVVEPADLVAAKAEYRFLAVADPRAVPAGRYARAHLERQNVNGATLWAHLADRVAPALDVRAALALVESDPEILGIVYRTDARTSEKVRVLYEFPPVEEVRITYWGALIVDGEALELGGRFLEFLQSPEGAAIAERHGFVPLGS